MGSEFSDLPKGKNRRPRRALRRGGFDLASLALAFALSCTSGMALSQSRVVLEPTKDPALSEILQNSFTLPLLIDQPSLSEADLAFEIEAERNKLEMQLRGLGYLDARVQTTGDASVDDPLRLKPVPGELYRVGWIRIDGLPQDVSDDMKNALKSLSAGQAGNTATQEVVESIRSGVLYQLREASFGMASVVAPELKTEPLTRTAGIVLAVEPGVPMVFGNVVFDGSFRVEDIEARAFVPFLAGDPYRRSDLDALENALEATNAFRRIKVELADVPNAEGQFDVHVELRDRTPDPERLASRSGMGPALLILTMLMIALREGVRVTSLWSSRPLRRGLAVSVAALAGASGLVILQRLIVFLA